MKRTRLPFTAGALASFLCGCAGYNHTLFMTKSNVGLDFDSKPPTLEISISRKEAVIAPSFEGGQTPPVMASFKPHAGSGNAFGSFFLGVDQTFAGGDAAMAMAMLYNKPTATDPTPYDSTIPLTAAPDYCDWFRKIPGAGATRPFIFGTDTSFGLKAAWSGAGGQIPDTVRLGFNRKEFAWAPLSATPASNARGNTAVNVKMPAFLATIESRQNLAVNGATRVQGLQYFATGKSATHLAMQADVRKAMHARLDPNNQAFQTKFRAQGHDLIPDILFSTERVLTRYAQRGDQRASDLLARMNNLPNLGLPANYRNDAIPIYVFDTSNPAELVLKKNHGGQLNLGQALSDATACLSSLELSQLHLTNALAHIARGQTVKLQDGSPAAPKSAIDAAIATRLATERAELKRRAEELVEALASSPDVEAAYEFTQRKLNP